MAEYMQRVNLLVQFALKLLKALAHPTHGYYMKKDVFGVKGDFSTTP